MLGIGNLLAAMPARLSGGQAHRVALGRLLLPGPDPMGIGMTILVGVLGSFAAGLFSWYVLHRHGAGLVLSVVFSMLLLFVVRRSGARRGK